ncbi:DNA cross-link repair protein SNM1 [Cornus florida]|uniref:DNA cross-link repair protein SNM1 n=1 Tax=Cornus florida TaxID=4283 RepID=UPI00289C06F4|nr:DNA cross-link repair protein SNM1 [Cornus florida]
MKGKESVTEEERVAFATHKCYDYDCDDNEFLPFQLSSEEPEDDGGKDAIEIATAEQEESFAANFYRCGMDWSCLLPNTNTNTTGNIVEVEENNNQNPCEQQIDSKKNKGTNSLKQTTLFHMWGFQKDMNMKNKPSTTSSTLLSGMMKSKQPHLLPPIMGKINKSSGGGGGGNSSEFAHKYGQQPRVCPFYKKIPGTPFTVDAFCYGRIEGCSAFILSHFHADHYRGLSKRWSHGPIYCTSLTARLVSMCLSVDPIFLFPVEFGKEYLIEGIRMTMLEANHCPGAALIHFRLPNGQCYLHTGDFRASKLMHIYPLLVNQRVNVLYLDTTYCNPKYRFPSKEDVLSFVVGVTKNCLMKQPKTLVIVGAYSLGKECVYLAISKALGVKIYANALRRRVLQSLGWTELSGNLCSNGKDTPLHVLPISSLKFQILENYLKTYMNQYTAVLAFRPTGWTYSEAIGSHLDLIKPRSKGIVTIYGVPYSEHSSFTELQEFVQFLRPDKIIPTVNVGNAANREKMQSYFQEWLKGG